MRIYLVAFLLLICTNNAFAQTTTMKEEKASFLWEYEEVDLGKINQGKPLNAVFKFTNESKIPLVITHVTTSCGCAATEYSNKPILTGKTSTITVTYDAKELGVFNKGVTVYSNTGLPVVLRIKGEVITE